MKIKNQFIVQSRSILCLGLTICLPVILSACQGDERLSQMTSLQTRAQLEQELKVREERAQILEDDLTTRQNFYQSVSGTYEGKIVASEGEYLLRIRLVPSVPPYRPGSRIRTPEEVISDLNNLYFKAQIVQWKEGSSIGAMGCRVDHVRPDLNEGSISIASSDCPSFYQIYISDLTSSASVDLPVETMSNLPLVLDRARVLASSLMSQRNEPVESRVRSIVGKVFPTSAAKSFAFGAKKID